MERSPLIISLYVPDVQAAVDFYVNVLGFTHSGSWTEDGEPIWAEVARTGPKGEARIWFFSHNVFPGEPPKLTGVVYLFVEDVDAEAERIAGKATVRWGPEDMPYGLRELGIEDPHGYLLVFARDLDMT